jgi:hypothetical protein
MKIKLIGPHDKVVKRKPTFEEIGLKHQMSQFYSLKSTMELSSVTRCIWS